MLTAGGVPLHARRLQRDVLFDTNDSALQARGCALRIRTDGPATLLTFKGPAQPGDMKTRTEHETTVADSTALTLVLEGLGFRAWFRYEKYREEFSAPGVTVAVDETPIGTFVEIEGDESGIRTFSRALGRTDTDFVCSSYRRLFTLEGGTAGLTGSDMLFPQQ